MRFFLQQLPGGCLLASFGAFLLVINGDGLGSAILMLSQGEQTDMVANHFSIHGQSLRQSARLGLQPVAEQGGEGLGIQPGENFAATASAFIPAKNSENAGLCLAGIFTDAPQPLRVGNQKTAEARRTARIF